MVDALDGERLAAADRVAPGSRRLPTFRCSFLAIVRLTSTPWPRARRASFGAAVPAEAVQPADGLRLDPEGLVAAAPSIRATSRRIWVTLRDPEQRDTRPATAASIVAPYELLKIR